jgi:proline iminopeptidase
MHQQVHWRTSPVLAAVNGCRVFFERMGLRDATTILALHSPGGSVDSRYVKTIFRPFCDDYQVVIFDLRGCGRSEDSGYPSFAQLSADAEMLRKNLRLGKVIVAGSSGAGYLALDYTLRYPASVRGLMLWSTAPKHTSLVTLKKKARTAGLALDWDRFDRYWSGHCRDNADLKRSIQDFNKLNAILSPSYRPGRDRAKRYWRYATHNYVMQEQNDDWGVESKLKEIGVPTLVMHGDQDWIIPLEEGKRLGAGIPDSEMQIFKGCGHWIHAERPQKFESIVRRFLEREETKVDRGPAAHK